MYQNIQNFHMVWTLDTCTGMKCQPNQVCEVVENKAVCRCPKVSDCGYNPAPVCGSDGKEYPNECLLKVRSCSVASGSGGLVILNKGKCRKFLWTFFTFSFIRWNFFFHFNFPVKEKNMPWHFSLLERCWSHVLATVSQEIILDIKV